jgi:hypothetical protein
VLKLRTTCLRTFMFIALPGRLNGLVPKRSSDLAYRQTLAAADQIPNLSVDWAPRNKSSLNLRRGFLAQLPLEPTLSADPGWQMQLYYRQIIQVSVH